MTCNTKSFCLLIIFFCTYFSSGYAQSGTFNVVGVIEEAINNKPIPFATIQVFKDSLNYSPIYSCISDSIGFFKINLASPGDYSFVFSCVGKQMKSVKTHLGNDNMVDLGHIRLVDSSNEIEEVSVVAAKPIVEVHSDKLVYNVASDAGALSSNLLSIAEKVPLLNVEPEIGVSLNNCTPLILINGRESKSVNKDPISYLRSISASRVEKIEVITTAGSKYNSDANCGVINIVYKKQDNHSLAVGGEWLNLTGYNTYLDLGLKYKKFVINANVGYDNGKNFNSTEYSERLIKNDTTYYNLVQNGQTKQDYEKINSYSLEASYDLDSLKMLSFAGSYYSNRMRNNTTQSNKMSDVGDNQVYLYSLDEEFNSKWKNYELLFNYKSISRNQKNTFNFSALKNNVYINRVRNQLILDAINYQLPDFNNSLDEESDENSFQIDFDRKINDSTALSLGTKIVLRNNNSMNTLAWEENEDVIEEVVDFDNTQQIWSLYTEYSFKLSKNYKFNTGLRFETTAISADYKEVEPFSSTYANLLPYLLISKKVKAGVLLNAKYNSKIYRPSIQALNPTHYIIDANNIYFGNPELTSEYLNSLSIGYSNNLRLVKQFIQLSYSFSNNIIQNYSYIEDDIYYTTYTNDGELREINLFTNLSARLTNWFKLRINGSASYIDINTQNESNTGWTGMLYAGSYFNLPKDYNINVSGVYRFPSVLSQGFGYNYYSFRVKANKVFFDNRLNVSITAAHPFWENRTYNKTIDSNDLRVQTEKSIVGREFSVSISYAFNNKDIRSKMGRKKIVNEDLKGSIGAQ